MEGAILVNIPEVLVTHRWGFENISIAKGEKLQEEVRMLSARLLSFLDVKTENYSPYLFSGWRARPEEFAKQNITLFLQQGYRLIHEILEKNRRVQYCNETILRKVLFERWNWIRESCGLKFNTYEYDEFDAIETIPTVSVVLPTFNSVKFLSKAIDSVLDQTYTDWELLVVNDFGSDDGTAELVQMYAFNDKRIRLIQADTRLGLSESLNLGMREARGKYIARLDADDTALPERFAKQVAFMEAHPNVGICGTWQHHYGKEHEWVHEADPDPDRLKCRLLFWCDLCHSTLMLRRDVFIQNNLFYSPAAQAEDFELWARAMKYTDIVNIPEVLGTYNESTGITGTKMQELISESGEIAANTIREILGIQLDAGESRLLNSWCSPISKGGNRDRELSRLKAILTEIWEKNKEVAFFEPKLLLQTLAAKWFWAKDNIDWKNTDYRSVHTIEDAFSDAYRPSLIVRYQSFKLHNPKFSTRMKKIVKRLLRPAARLGRRVVLALSKDALLEISKHIENWTWERYKLINKDIQSWTWDRYQHIDSSFQRVENQIAAMSSSFGGDSCMIPYYCGSKIRVVFLFQVASFWPAQEAVYQKLNQDPRFDVVLVCYDEPIDKSIKTTTAREYLTTNCYEFVPWESFEIKDFNPHIVFLQTPYDGNRRNIYKSTALKRAGYRVVYIPYGIEIADTEHARFDHFKRPIINNAWKIYTFSETMRADYLRYCSVRPNVQALGLPRFDALYHREQFKLNQTITQRANGRKIILWKVHFPKVISTLQGNILVTPDIKEYLAFAKEIEEYGDFFFIFMPHPRFEEFNDDQIVRAQTRQLVAILRNKSNVYIDSEDDYRPSLMNADAIIVDRSAVMVEAAAVNVPILYMDNAEYHEPMTKAIEPLINSYYHGTTYRDIAAFIQQFRQNEDPKKAERERGFNECVPYFDGKCSERIKEDIIASLEQEHGESLSAQFAAQNIQFEERITRLEQSLQAYISEKRNNSLREYAEKEEELFTHLNKQMECCAWDSYRRTEGLSSVPSFDIHNNDLQERICKLEQQNDLLVRNQEHLLKCLEELINS